MAKLAFLGTPETAVEPLRTLVGAGHEVVLVVSRADKRRGRGGAVAPSPVKAAALELGLPVTDTLDSVAEAGAELGVVVAYGRIIPGWVLDAVPMVNLHFSLLPRWRGAAPVERAILEGDAETGVCLMAVEAGLDTGAVYAVGDTSIGEEESADELRSRLVEIGCRLLEENLAGGFRGLPVPHDQEGEPSYAEKIRPEELELDWAEHAVRLSRVVRLGRAWTTFRGHRLGVLRARVEPDPSPYQGAAIRASDAAVLVPEATARTHDAARGNSGAAPGTLADDIVAAGGGTRLRLLQVQPAGRRAMAAEDWLRGTRPTPSERLGS